MRDATCCFTGHRPEKLTVPYVRVREALEREIKKAVKQGKTTFISGASRGVDLWAALIVLDERDAGAPLRLICAIPHQGFGRRWDKGWRNLLDEVTSRADETVILSPKFSYSAYEARNRWMVDRASLVIAVYNGSPGGTGNTISYAKKHGAETVLIEG